MKIKCPVCDKENDVGYGKYICTDCKSKFELITNGTVRLIKRNRFDYWTFLYSITFPLMFLIFVIRDQLYDKEFNFSLLAVGLMFVVIPFLTILKRGWFGDNDAFLIFYLYDKFFKKELKKEDIGRIISFYVIFLQNILGLIFLIIGLIK